MNKMLTLLKDLKADYIDSKHYCIKSKDTNNPWTINVYKNVVYNGSEWAWKVDTQVFSNDVYATSYLKTRIQEKTTGIRIIYQDTHQIPDICGIGTHCRAEGRNWEFSMLCSSCPKAHKHQADAEGLTVVYRTENIKKRKDFIEKCGELLRLAKPDLISCDLRFGKELPDNLMENYIPDDEYVLVTCVNDAFYIRPIEANSLCEITVEIFTSMKSK